MMIDRFKTAGFTILELLVVMAILVILASLMSPSISYILQGSNVSVSGELCLGALKLARQTALARNHQVEVRFYQYADADQAEVGLANGHYRGIQLFEINDSGTAIPRTKLQKLSLGVIIDSNSTLSSILTLKNASATNALPTVGTNYNCASFRFRADGSTGLTMTAPSPPGTWCLTLHTLKVPGVDGLNSPPPNYITFQIDPLSGSVMTFRPR
jgi:uncharacterized protein (TIGR02596 family)